MMFQQILFCKSLMGYFEVQYKLNFRDFSNAGTSKICVFRVFTYTKLENSDPENSDFSKPDQNSVKRYKLKEKTYF